MYLGINYCPEGYSKGGIQQRIEADVEHMKALKINVVRMSGFAGCLFEKEEETYDFTLIDDIIQKLGDNGIKTILAVPAVEVQGIEGRQYCINSPDRHEYTEKIIEKLAQHYKSNKDVMGWQIDCKIDAEPCSCDHCQKAFRKWLSRKYINIEELNQAWSTVFRKRNYRAFDEIPLPEQNTKRNIRRIQLDYCRFLSDSAVRYIDLQASTIRRIVKYRQFVAADLYGDHLNKYLNHDHLMAGMGLVSYGGDALSEESSDKMHTAVSAFNLDFMRGIKQKGFFIVEPPADEQEYDQTTPRSKERQTKLWTYRAIAHGAQAVFYSPGAVRHFDTEALTPYDDVQEEKYEEIKGTLEELNQYEKDFIYEPIKAQAAYLYSWDNIWAWKVQPLRGAANIEREMYKYYLPLYRNNVATDIISINQPLQGYKLIVAPILALSDEITADYLKVFVKDGGLLILTYRTGAKPENNGLTNKILPGDYAELLGIKIHKYESLQGGQNMAVTGIRGRIAGMKTQGTLWADFIEPEGATVLAEYSGEGLYKGTPAITVNHYGKGRAYYIGTAIGAELLDIFYEEIFKIAKIPYERTEEGVEILRRKGKAQDYLFILNTTSEVRQYNETQLQPYESRIAPIEKTRQKKAAPIQPDDPFIE